MILNKLTNIKKCTLKEASGRAGIRTRDIALEGERGNHYTVAA